jgi:hypothetical protein
MPMRYPKVKPLFYHFFIFFNFRVTCQPVERALNPINGFIGYVYVNHGGFNTRVAQQLEFVAYICPGFGGKNKLLLIYDCFAVQTVLFLVFGFKSKHDLAKKQEIILVVCRLVQS